MPKLQPTQWISLGVALVSCLSMQLHADEVATGKGDGNRSDRYREIVLSDQPIGYWRFDEAYAMKVANAASKRSLSLPGTTVGRVTFGRPGPRPKAFPLFGVRNLAGDFPSANGFVRIKDPGEKSPLDFDKGDSLTLEAWVRPRSLSGGGFHYIIGKGRTGARGFARNNQNYALRLKAPTGTLSFLFRSAGADGEWHRWTSKDGLSAGGGWRHVAVTYTFGKKDSVRGYIDGEPVKGSWDMGGATERAPVVDDDELRIGASLDGLLDEVAIYRTALTPQRIKARFKHVVPPMKRIDWDRLPQDVVLVEIFEGVADKRSWKFSPPQYVESFTTKEFAWVGVPKKYNARGIHIDRTNPFLIRAVGNVVIPKGQRRILLRCRNASRLFMDGRRIAETGFHNIPGNAHGKVFEVDVSLAPHIRPLARGDTQSVALIEGDGKPHRFRFEMIVGGRKHRPEFGETSVSIAALGEDFRLLGATSNRWLTDRGWREFAAQQRRELAALSTVRRREAGALETKYWDRRHALARKAIAQTPAMKPPSVSDAFPIHNDVDRFIGARLEEAKRTPAALIGDLAFLRRITLDAIGTIPTPKQIEEFSTDRKPRRRTRVIDRLLGQPGWADHWVGYWQDVLAENPSLVKPKLNNSGPFRWWLHESFTDNKPFDRFATELTRMEGSRHSGAPAGFEMATQNDVPMAAKAQIIGRAFLGMNMTCARCHDAPYHDFRQKDLFGLAAMLNRGPLAVPQTSSIPGGDAVIASLIVKVTLKPGSKVAPAWPYGKLIQSSALPIELRNPQDPRERLAALITSPSNRRFAQVIVNRLWKRYLGRGLVEPVDDWQDAECSQPKLLNYLAREFVLHDYDLKHVARLIFNSHVYQRTVRSEKDVRGEDAALFVGPLLRRMSAEQLVDSLFLAAGKPFDAGPMCLDIDTAMTGYVALNLGEPTRSWQFASLSNERDRPSLALPFAQPFVTTLKTFGWRSSRQNPLTTRNEDPTVLQPAVLANGVLGRRITRLSDDSAFVDMALDDQPLEQLVDRVYLRMLTRKPTASERKMFIELLQDGYERRRVKNAKLRTRKRLPRGLVSWSNHLNPKASEIKIELQRAVEQGDPPTARLDADWRERMEDMIWTLMTTPEFLYLP